MPLFVNNLQEKMKVDNRLLETMELVVKTALKIVGRTDDPEVTIALVDDSYMVDLNVKFRHEDRPTDVLSFPMSESNGEEPPVKGMEENILGDIIISLPTAERQAKEYKHSLLRETAYLAAHGMFHLLGYDHDSEKNRRVMREKEEKALSILNLTC